MNEVILKRFEKPDEIIEFEKGKFETVRMDKMVIGRATYQPGWKWSEHVGPRVGATRCHLEHVGIVLSGTATAAFDDGRVFELRAGELFLHTRRYRTTVGSSGINRTSRFILPKPIATPARSGNEWLPSSAARSRSTEQCSPNLLII
jgi:hypothetical protein